MRTYKKIYKHRVNDVALALDIIERMICIPKIWFQVENLGENKYDIIVREEQKEYICSEENLLRQMKIPSQEEMEKARTLNDRCVHTEHCCRVHGCKYSDAHCPVEKREKIQSFACESCSFDGETLMYGDK